MLIYLKNNKNTMVCLLICENTQSVCSVAAFHTMSMEPNEPNAGTLYNRARIERLAVEDPDKLEDERERHREQNRVLRKRRKEEAAFTAATAESTASPVCLPTNSPAGHADESVALDSPMDINGDADERSARAVAFAAIETAKGAAVAEISGNLNLAPHADVSAALAVDGVADARFALAVVLADIETARAAAVAEVSNLHAVVKLVGKPFFSEQGCVFSDPSGIGVTLPKVAVEILVKVFQKNKMPIQSNRVGVAKYNHLHVFPPTTIAHDMQRCLIENLLYQFGVFLESRDSDIASGNYGSIVYDTSESTGLRMINGKRIEIFMSDLKRSPSCFLTMIAEMLTKLAKDVKFAYTESRTSQDFIAVQVKSCFENYCNHLAMRDDRVRLAKTAYKFQNHAIIASYGTVEAQDVHIDLDEAHQYQFGVLLTPNSAPTCEYQLEDPSMKEFVSLLKNYFLKRRHARN